VKIKLIQWASLMLFGSRANAAVIDTVTLFSSKIIIGGGADRYSHLDRLLSVADGAIVESFTIDLLTVTGTSSPNSMQLVTTLNPFDSPGDIEIFFGITSITVDAHNLPDIFDALFGLIDGSGVTFPEEIRVHYWNDGQTSLKESTFGITANGILPPLPP